MHVIVHVCEYKVQKCERKTTVHVQGCIQEFFFWGGGQGPQSILVGGVIRKSGVSEVFQGS